LFDDRLFHLNTLVEYQNNAFTPLIESEKNPNKKLELQFMELVMLSRLPSLYKEEITNKFNKMNDICIPPKLIPIYDLAKQQFVEEPKSEIKKSSFLAGILGLF
jgi:hypothetical protein